MCDAAVKEKETSSDGIYPALERTNTETLRQHLLPLQPSRVSSRDMKAAPIGYSSGVHSTSLAAGLSPLGDGQAGQPTPQVRHVGPRGCGQSQNGKLRPLHHFYPIPTAADPFFFESDKLRSLASLIARRPPFCPQ